MFSKSKLLFVVCGIIFVGTTSHAGNLSLYSFTEGAADEGMPNLSSGDENVAIEVFEGIGKAIKKLLLEFSVAFFGV